MELKKENKILKVKLNGCDELLDNDMEIIDKYKSRCDKAIEYINHEIFKRTILVGVSTKKYTRNILDDLCYRYIGSDNND